MTLLEFHELRAAEVRSWDRERMAHDMAVTNPALVHAVENGLPRTRQVYHPDKLTRPRRDAEFENTLALCRRYREASQAERVYIRSRVDAISGALLDSFALRAAVLAAREHSVDLIRLALTAFAIADLEGTDIRDKLMSMPLLIRCARLAGADPAELMREIARESGPAMKALFEEQAAREPQTASLGSMGWYEVETAEGVGFTRTPPSKRVPST